MAAPRNIEEAIALTQDEVMTRGVTELRQRFASLEFSNERLATALEMNDLNVASAAEYLVNLVQGP